MVCWPVAIPSYNDLDIFDSVNVSNRANDSIFRVVVVRLEFGPSVVVVHVLPVAAEID